MVSLTLPCRISVLCRDSNTSIVIRLPYMLSRATQRVVEAFMASHIPDARICFAASVKTGRLPGNVPFQIDVLSM
jgi:hypothetical protein